MIKIKNYRFKNTFILFTFALFTFSSVLHAQSTSPTQTVCYGAIKTYSVDSGGTPGSIYTWRVIDAGYAGVISGQGTANITIDWKNTPSGGYTLGVIESNSGCDGVEKTLAVTIKELPLVTVNSDQICAGLNKEIRATVIPADTGSDYEYTWITPSGVANPGNVASFFATVAGDYTVTVKDVANSCESLPGKGTLTVNPLPTATITAGSATTFCAGGSVTLTANVGAGLTYQWNDSSGIISGSTASSYVATQSSDYTVTVTDANGCTKTSNSINVVVNPLPTAIITAGSATTFCEGESVTLSANLGAGLTYQWNNTSGIITSGGTSSTYVATQSSDYTVTVTDANGCTKTSNVINVVVNPLPMATITAGGPTTFCDGESVTLSANLGAGLTYQWNNTSGIITSGGTSSTYVATQSSNYTVTVTNANGCVKTSPVQSVISNPLPTTSAISHN
jgi:hypothetical protein